MALPSGQVTTVAAPTVNSVQVFGRQVGVSLGVAIIASILAAHMSLSRAPQANEVNRALTGVHGAFGVAVLLALVAAVWAWFIRDEDAAPTMVARKLPVPAA